MPFALPALPRPAVVFLVACIAASCKGDESVAPAPDVCASGGASLTSLAIYQGATVRGADLQCIRLSSAGEYIVIPQMLGTELPYAYQPFLIGDPRVPITGQGASSSFSIRDDAAHTPSAQQHLHTFLRTRESALARTSHMDARVARSADVPRASAYAPTVAPAAHRDFSVLSSLTEPPRFARVSAGLRFGGKNVLLYVDDRSAATYSDAELTSLGTLFDDVLYPVDRDAFGAESDIDGNGRIVVLFTPTVNALVAAADCASSGFATGFFYGFDLASAAPESNRGEIFYAMVPDPGATYSCPHSRSDVATLLPSTFVHEFQHMISYGHHVITRSQAPEDAWLNEGLSHLAEELGALAFEARYPAPAGRARPAQIFPDSAEPFIIGNLINSYRFLRFSEQYTVTSCAPGTFCATPERGGAWLFLRWLADATRDPRLFDKLVHSDLRGTRNVAAVAGKSFGDLFADFATATWADSLIGSPRASTAPTHRFASRNLRQLYSALFEAYGPLGGIPLRYPVEPLQLAAEDRMKSAMRPGSLQTFHVRASGTRAQFALSFTSGTGAPFSPSADAQLSILRIPPR